MPTELLAYLFRPPVDADRVSVARDLVAVRVLAHAADAGNPSARAFLASAQETLGQAGVRRHRAARLRAGASRAALRGRPDLARMGMDAAAEEDAGADLLECDVRIAIRGAHDAVGYYDDSEKRLLARKAYEASLSSAAREDLANKLLSQLYQSADVLGGDRERVIDATEAFGIAADAYGGDLDTVFGPNAAERTAAVLHASGQRLQALSRALSKRLPREAGEDAREIADMGSFMLGASVALGHAEDQQDRLDRYELSLLDQSVDYGDEDRLHAGIARLSGLSPVRLRCLARDVGRPRVQRRSARALLSGMSGEAEAIPRRLRSKSDRALRAIAADPLRSARVRQMARIEMSRRATVASTPDSAPVDRFVASPPSAFDESSYLASYRGVTPGRQALVGYFADRAAAFGIDSPTRLARVLGEEDAFGGFFDAVGEFFRNLFAVGARDQRRIAAASAAARTAQAQTRKALGARGAARDLFAKRIAVLEASLKKTKDPKKIHALNAQILDLRAKLRSIRSTVRAARKEAFDRNFSASAPTISSAPSSATVMVMPEEGAPRFPVTGRPILARGSRGDLVRALQRGLNRAISASIDEDGVFGPSTLAAVRRLQKQNSLAVDGKVGPATAAVLAAHLGVPS